MSSNPIESIDTSSLRAQTIVLGNQDGITYNGVRVVEPPDDTRQAERGSFYAVVELLGQHQQREQMVEHLLSVLQRTYYSAKGKQSAVLLESLRQAISTLHEFNTRYPQSPLQASVICAGFLRGRLIVTSAGPAFALVRIGHKVDMYPQRMAEWPVAEPTDVGEAQEVFRWDMRSGDVFFLGSGNWERAGALRTVAATVAHVDGDTHQDAASGLSEEPATAPLAGALSIIEQTLPVSPAARSDHLTEVQPTSRRAGAVGLPTSVFTSPPLTSTPRAIEPPSVLPNNAPYEPLPAFDSLGTAESDEDEEGSAAPTPVAPTERRPSWTSAGLPTGWNRLQTFVRNLLPETWQGPHANPTAAQLDSAAILADETRPDTHPVRPSRPFVAPSPADGSRRRMFILGSLLIALLIPAIVAAIIWRNGAATRAEAEAMLELASARLAGAQTAIDTGNKAGALTALTEAREALVNRAAMLSGPDYEADQLNVQIERLSQLVLQVQPLYGLVQPLIQFPAGSRPTRVIVVAQDIFVLDEGRQAIQHYLLDESLELVPDGQGEAVIKQGDKIDDATVGALIDLAWQPPIPGYEDKPNLIVLDANSQVFRYDPRVAGPGAITLGGGDKLKSVKQLESYSGRLYLADIASNQLYRFPPGEYDAEPELWFSPQTQVKLTGLRTMRIDGNIWMLFDNGQVMRFFNGEQASFALDSSVGNAREPVDLAVSQQELGNLYLADRAEQRVMVFKKDGSYYSQLRAAEGNLLENLSGIFIEEDTGSLYLLTDTALFKHPLPR